MNTALLKTIGDTPLIALEHDGRARLYAKIESANPGGSIKDRAALFLIEDAERRGVLSPGGTIIEASSGNQAAALAMIGAAKGYAVIITAPEKISQEKLATIKAYGARVVTCPGSAQAYLQKAQELHESLPGSFMPNQYYNTLNVQGHYSWLGPEIWRQMDGQITHFIAAAGTGGTISGVGRYIKERNPNCKIIAVDSNCSTRSTDGNPQPYALEGMGLNFPESPVIDYTVIDTIVSVADSDALAWLPLLAQQQGLLVGMSSGAAAHVAFQYARILASDARIVVVFPDSGRAYLTKKCYD